MKRAMAWMAVSLSAAAFVACGKDPADPGGGGDPQLTLSADSVIVDVGASASVGATVLNASEPAQFVSRDPGVATVSAGGAISGVAVGSTYVVATLPGRDDVRDSVRVRVRVPVDGEWGLRANLLINNSEFALAEANGKLYVLGGYPPQQGPNRTSSAVQVYDIASDTWQLGPPLPQPNNHGMAASVNGKVYLIGGQTTDDQQGATAVDKVYELDPAVGTWVEKARMPTARSGGVAVAHGGKIYVAGGRVPRGNDFAVYDPAADQWEALPDLPSQRNHIAGAAINGRIHIVGGRLGNGLSPVKSDAHEVFDPQTRTWTTAAPMLSGRSGINGVVARGCFHVWGGESPSGMSPQHEYYDPRTNQWASLRNMQIPIHGVVGSAFVDGLIWVTGGGTNVGGSFGSLFNQTYRPIVSCE
jgi:N-acetylneuraminic acid mutarotase